MSATSEGGRLLNDQGIDMARLPIALGALLLLAACGSGDGGKGGAAEPVAVGDAFCRPTPNGRLMTGCYLTMTARADDRLLGASATGAGRVELHESRMESGMMMMHPMANGLPLPEGRLIELKPGGNHIMVMGLTEPLEDGDSLEFTLDFERAPDARVTAWVRQPEAE